MKGYFSGKEKKNWGWLTMGMHNLYGVWTSCENGPKMFLYKLGSMNWRWSLAFIIAQAASGACGSAFSDSVSSQPLDLNAQLSVSITKVRLCLLSQPSSAAPWLVGWGALFGSCRIPFWNDACWKESSKKRPCESNLSPGSTLPALWQTLHVPLRNKN